MSDGGYLKLYRSMRQWGWYKDANTMRVFVHLLLSANWEESEYMGVKICAGEAVYGRKKYAAALGLSEQQVRTAMQHLQKTGEISTIKATNRFSVIKIEKWALYQSQDAESNQQPNQRATSNQPAINQQLTTSKNNKNIRNKEDDIYSPGSRPDIVEIVRYLNFVTGSSYKAFGKKTQSLIRARMADGFTVDDFKTVIDKKAAEWLGTDMAKYLRPETLFGTKFEGYLNQPEKPNIFNIEF